jgi:hypothetical protein
LFRPVAVVVVAIKEEAEEGGVGGLMGEGGGGGFLMGEGGSRPPPTFLAGSGSCSRANTRSTLRSQGGVHSCKSWRKKKHTHIWHTHTQKKGGVPKSGDDDDDE